MPSIDGIFFCWRNQHGLTIVDYRIFLTNYSYTWIYNLRDHQCGTSWSQQK